jgi:CRP-like cAMP-binding protein
MLFASSPAPELHDHVGIEPQSEPHLAQKLRQFGGLSTVEASALHRLLAEKTQRVGAGIPLIEQGETPLDMHVVLSGWACRSRVAPNGRRQIVAFHLPGDVCDFSVFLMRQMDSTITALSDMRVASIGRTAMTAFTKHQPRVAQGLWWESLSAGSIQREWLVRNGQRGASERIASLICELAARLYVVGLADDEGFAMPLTQYDLADACAMTPEHTNRTLRELRQTGIVTVERGMVRFDDWDRLCALAAFEPSYLHFTQTYATQSPPSAPAPATVSFEAV